MSLLTEKEELVANLLFRWKGQPCVPGELIPLIMTSQTVLDFLTTPRALGGKVWAPADVVFEKVDWHTDSFLEIFAAFLAGDDRVHVDDWNLAVHYGLFRDADFVAQFDVHNADHLQRFAQMVVAAALQMGYMLFQVSIAAPLQDLLPYEHYRFVGVPVPYVVLYLADELAQRNPDNFDVPDYIENASCKAWTHWTEEAFKEKAARVGRYVYYHY